MIWLKSSPDGFRKRLKPDERPVSHASDFSCRSRQRGQPLDEEGAGGWIGLEADRQTIGAARCLDLAQFRAKVGARNPIGFESGETALRPHLVQQFQSRGG